MILPLHASLKQQPPTIIVSALIAAYPKAVSQKCDGDLPIHIAIRNGASLDVIQNLVIALPSALNEQDSQGLEPIEIFKRSQSLWSDKEEMESIEKLLNDGIDNIVLQQKRQKSFRGNGTDGTTESALYPEVKDMFQAETNEDDQEMKKMLTTNLREEGWLVVSCLRLVTFNLLEQYALISCFLISFLFFSQTNSHQD